MILSAGKMFLRNELTSLEQMVLIQIFDQSWKDHLFAMDLLRYLPGVAFNQSGSPGGVTSLFLRGGNSNLNLVQIDGVPASGRQQVVGLRHLLDQSDAMGFRRVDLP